MSADFKGNQENGEVTRRSFLKTAGLSVVAFPAVATAQSTPQQAAALDRHALIASIGDTLIPDEPGDPGYKSLEAYNITAEVMKGLTGLRDEDLALFNNSSGSFFGSKPFVELNESQRAEYLQIVIDGKRFDDKQLAEKLQSVYRLTRMRVMMVYYQNYPEHLIPRDKNDVPILPAGDTHQITNPNTSRIYTGWDRASYHGPLTWEEEEKRRAIIKKLDWKE